MAGQKKPGTVAVCEALIAPVLRDLGLELWDTRFEKEGGGWFLRFFVDHPGGGVTIQELEQVSRAVDALLDEADPIAQSYVLEVGSPGVERQLTKDWHYGKCRGRTVLVRLIRPVESRRDFVGELLGKGGNTVTIRRQDGGGEMAFQLGEAAYVRLYYDFETGGQTQ